MSDPTVHDYVVIDAPDSKFHGHLGRVSAVTYSRTSSPRVWVTLSSTVFDELAFLFDEVKVVRLTEPA